MRNWFGIRLLSAFAMLSVIASVQLAPAQVSTDEQYIEIKESYNTTRDLLPVNQKFGAENLSFYLRNPQQLSAPNLLPLIQTESEANVSLRAGNHTPVAYWLSVPSQKINVYVPIQSERTVTVDLSKTQKGQTIPYYLTNEEGKQVAGGYILDGVIVKKQLYSATQQQHAEWSKRLQQLIIANEYRAPIFPKKPEPKYITPTPKPAKKGTTVRGFW